MEEAGAEQGQFVKICSRADLPPSGEAREISVGGRTLCLANLNGTVSALNNECPHHGGPLGQGTIENGRVVCPWHAYAFDPTTGAAEHNPALRVPVYQIELVGEDVLVKL